jgi:hypothetical protein
MRLLPLALLLSLVACRAPGPDPDPAEAYLARAFEWGLGDAPAEIATHYREAPDVYNEPGGKVWIFYPGGFLNREAYVFNGDSCTVVQRARVYDTEVVMLQALEQRVADIRASGVPLVMNGSAYEYQGARVKMRIMGRPDGLSMNTRRYELVEAFFPAPASAPASGGQAP